jgi:probable rRNA maturation factor
LFHFYCNYGIIYIESDGGVSNLNHYEIINEYGKDIKCNFLPKIIDKCLEMEHVENAIFSIIFIDDEKMHELNKTYRGIDRTTDVLSFAYEDNETLKSDYRMLGEIFVSIPKMEGQALEYGHSTTRELSFLVVHGILHLLGYDHTLGEKEEKEMFSRQELVLNEFKEIIKK